VSETYDSVYEDAGRANGIDPDLIRAVHHVESGGDNDNAISSTGALGRGQFMPGTARELGINPTWAPDAIHGTARYLRQNADKLGGDPAAAVMAYYAGPGGRATDDVEGYARKVHADYTRRVAAREREPEQVAEAPQQPNIREQIETARKSGFNDQQIGDYLRQSKTWGPKFEAARQAGYGDDAVYKHLGLNPRPGRLPPAELDQPTSAEHPQSPPGVGPSEGELANDAATAPAPSSMPWANYGKELQQRHAALAEAGEAVNEAAAKGYTSAPPLINPQSGPGQWLSQHGMAGLTQPIVPLGAINTVIAAGSEAATQAAKYFGGKDAGKAVGEVMDWLQTGAPELHGARGPAVRAEPTAAVPEVEQGLPTVHVTAPKGDAAAAEPSPPAAQSTGIPALDRMAAQARERNAAREAAPEAEGVADLQKAAAGEPAEGAIDALQRKAGTEPEPPPQAAPPKAETQLPEEPPFGEPPPTEAPENFAKSAENPALEQITPYEPTPKEPERLSQFLRRQGGISDEGGDVRSTLGGAKYRPGLISKTGLPMDEAALRAWEAGYFPDLGDQRPSINDLRDALNDDLKYRPRYSMLDDASVANYERAKFANSEIDRLASQHGIETEGKTRDQFMAEVEARRDQSPGAQLYSFPGALFDPEAWKRAFGPLAKPLRGLRDNSAAIAKSFRDDMLFPMGKGDTFAQASLADVANLMRQNNYHFNEIDRGIKSKFGRQERDAMGRAMDAQSVFEQQVRQMPPDMRDAARAEFDAGHTGLTGLSEPQRQMIDALDAISQNLWHQMQERGMVAPEAQGLPYYMPRRMLMWSEEQGFTRPQGGTGASITIDQRGNLSSTAGPMRREHLTPEETEAAAQAKLGPEAQMVRDIRALPNVLSSIQRAIIARDLIDKIDRVGKETGVQTVVRGDIPGLLNPADYTTMPNHPAFREWTGTGYRDIRIPVGFEGPIKAVITEKSPQWYRTLQSGKSGLMSVIMASPYIHLGVEMGRALAVMPMRVLTLQALRDGRVLRQDLDYMDRAIQHGLAPLGRARSGWVDLASIADEAREPVSEGAFRRAVMAIPHAWEQVHQRLLWDKVFDLQVGIYNHMTKEAQKKGFAPDVAATIGAHFANRYAGALPPEHLSKGANMAANLLLFSRSFTLGNAGVLKDMFNGAPSHIRARIEEMAGPDVAKSAKQHMKREARAAVALDIGFFYIANALVQAGLQVLRDNPVGGSSDDPLVTKMKSYASNLPETAQNVFNDWYDQAAFSLHDAVTHNPLSIFGVLPQHWNEPGKQDHVYAGVDSNGRGIYLSLPPGKVGKEFINWPIHFGPMLMNKLSPGPVPVRPFLELGMGYDTLGRAQLPPHPETMGDWLDTAGAIVQHLASNWGPTMMLQGGKELFQQYALGQKTQADPGVSAMKLLGPLTGAFTVSQGVPGGRAAGEALAQRQRNEYALQKAMPDIRKQIINGDTEGAWVELRRLGMEPREIGRFIRQTQNPTISGRTRRMIEQTGTPEVKERFRRAQEHAP